MNKRFFCSTILLVLITSLAYAFFNHEEKKEKAKNTFPNFLKETHWVTLNTMNLLGVTTDSVWTLAPKTKESKILYSGIDFYNNKFSSYEVWPCGNDCFIDANGIYSLENDSILKITCQKVEGNSYCGELNFSKKEQLFKISIKKDTIKLTRLNK